MAATSTTLLDSATISDGDTISAGAAPDLGDSQTLEIVVTVHQAAEGDSPALLFQHSPDGDETWLNFDPPVRVSLARAGDTWVHVPHFTRYVGWSAAGFLETSASVSVKLVGKS